jgi:hypothetical protein
MNRPYKTLLHMQQSFDVGWKDGAWKWNTSDIRT